MADQEKSTANWRNGEERGGHFLWGHHALMVHPFAHGLCLTSLGLVLEASLFGTPRGAGGAPLFGWGEHPLDEADEASKGGLAIHLPASVLPRFDDDHAGIRDAMVGKGKKPLFDNRRKGRGLNVKSEVDRGGGRVDMLAPRPRRLDA